VIDGVSYKYGEQWLMAEKARLFGDDVQLKKILKSNSPKDIKAFGRLVKGFDDKVWLRHAQKIAYRGAVAKFGQNTKLRALLLSTGSKTIVEASPHDDRWGIGFAVSDMLQNRRAWGTNWLGKSLMKARATIRRDAGAAHALRSPIPPRVSKVVPLTRAVRGEVAERSARAVRRGDGRRASR